MGKFIECRKYFESEQAGLITEAMSAKVYFCFWDSDHETMPEWVYPRVAELEELISNKKENDNGR